MSSFASHSFTLRMSKFVRIMLAREVLHLSETYSVSSESYSESSRVSGNVTVSDIVEDSRLLVDPVEDRSFDVSNPHEA